MPAAAVAVVLAVGAVSALAAPAHDTQHQHANHTEKHEKQSNERRKSHVSLHLSGHDLLAGNGVAIAGKVRPSGHHRVRIAFKGPESGHRGVWTKPNGTFSLRWVPGETGTYQVRAYGLRDRRIRGGASEARNLASYRLAGASWYGGPSLWGHGVACGGTLMPGTLGVANKTLPCGTEVHLRYHGREITVPVIDRGPYIAGREYDLTYATKERLGFPGVGTVMATK